MRVMTIVISLFFLFSSAWAEPCFDDYAVEVYSGPIAKPEKNSANEAFFSALVEAANSGVNFAGKYIVFHYSCGGGCITGGVLDVVTGRVVAEFPDEFVAGDDPETFMSKYRKNSRLILIQGTSAFDEEFIQGYYEMSGEKLTAVKK